MAIPILAITVVAMLQHLVILGYLSSKFAQYIYFNNIDQKVFETQETENFDGTFEARYFIPKLPMALLVSTFGIGLGYRSTPAHLNFNDLVKLVNKYITLQASDQSQPIKITLRSLVLLWYRIYLFVNTFEIIPNW